MTDLIRVLVVDDSAFARKVVRQILSASPRIQVVDVARDGLEALERISELKPDVVTLDLVMPHLDGLGVLKALPAEGAPRVVVVSTSDAESELGLAALQAGAVDLVHKPTALATDRLYQMAGEIVRKVELAAIAKAPVPRATLPPAPPPAPAPAAPAPRVAKKARMLVIGASTGGPQALTQLLAALPGDLPVPAALVVHMPVGYTITLARRLDQICALTITEAVDGMELEPGMVAVARAGMHLRVDRREQNASCSLDLAPLGSLHRPSVDVLFQSAAAAYGAGTLGVVLTGMGDDGLEGARAIRAAGGQVITEAESSCVIYGMPRSVQEAGLSNAEVPLDEMAAEILRRL